jgi:ABC-type sugar transport system substrate-binding protein
MSAIEFLADRLEGKAVARVESSSADARELDLAAVMQLVLQHRKADAVDVQPAQADTAQADTAQAVDASIPALPQKP